MSEIVIENLYKSFDTKDGKVEADFCNEETKGGHEDDFKEV